MRALAVLDDHLHRSLRTGGAILLTVLASASLASALVGASLPWDRSAGFHVALVAPLLFAPLVPRNRRGAGAGLWWLGIGLWTLARTSDQVAGTHLARSAEFATATVSLMSVALLLQQGFGFAIRRRGQELRAALAAWSYDRAQRRQSTPAQLSVAVPAEPGAEVLVPAESASADGRPQELPPSVLEQASSPT